MAATFQAAAQAIAFASAKSMIDVFNATGSGRKIRIYRFCMLNNQTGAVTGVVTLCQVRLITTASAGTAVTPVKHNSGDSNLNANTTAGTNRTVTQSSIVRQFAWSSDEPTVGTGTWDELECVVPLNYVWDSGYGDSNVEPLLCNDTQGWNIQQPGANAVGTVDADIEFTDAAA
jgi:hypothetical protein